METFEVKRGLAKKLAAAGGLAGVAGKHFENVDGSGDSFNGSHGIMTSITAEYNAMGKLVVDVSQERPDFDDPGAMEVAMDSRRRWSAFLDEATGYSAKQRGDKAKEFAKKASKAKSGIIIGGGALLGIKKLYDRGRYIDLNLNASIEAAEF